MTTSAKKLLCLSLFLAACIGGGSARRGGLPEEVVKTFPPDVEASYRLFAKRCSRCHTLSRPLEADIDNVDHWEEYVNRMRRQAGSGISPKDAQEILVFLKYYTALKNERTQDQEEVVQ